MVETLSEGTQPATRPVGQFAANGWPAEWLQPDPEAPNTSLAVVHEAATRYVLAGLSLIPIAADGSKSPDWRRLPWHWDELAMRRKPGWQVYQVRRPRQEELQDWFETGGPCGLAVLGGAPTSREAAAKNSRRRWTAW